MSKGSRDLGLLILMKKNISGRIVVNVSEISNLEEVKTIFEYNPIFKIWNLKTPLIKTKIIKTLLNYEGLSQEEFESLIEIYTRIFKYLVKVDKVENLELVNLFHKISYYSLKSTEDVKSYWEIWKKNRGLN